LYLFIGMTGLPPGEFSLTSPGTKIPGQVTPQSDSRELGNIPSAVWIRPVDAIRRSQYTFKHRLRRTEFKLC
jgi:hypothetical protein